MSRSFGQSLRMDLVAPDGTGNRGGTPSAFTPRVGSLSASSSRNIGLIPMGQWKLSTPNRRVPREPYRPRRNENLFTALQKTVKSVEEFEGTNYPSWSYWFKRKATSVPGRKGIWGHIDGSCVRPVEGALGSSEDMGLDSIELWDMDEAAIYCALYSSVANTVARSHIEECTTAKEVWDRLELVYGDPDAQLTKTAQLVRALAEGDDLKKMERLVQQLDGVISDELALWFVYDSMPSHLAAEVREMRKDKNISIPNSFERLRALLETKAEAKRRVKTPALPLDLRHYKYTGNGKESDGQLYVRSQNTCVACLGMGHVAFSNECPQTEVRLGLWGNQDPILVEQTARAVSAHQYRGLGLGLPGGVRMTRTTGAGLRAQLGLSVVDASPN
ncbi:hypothetical protein RhiJN_11300 [Ceratobasidium sp. AG-Ba]|nr:hypothetical protein RhiJN_11300 [Ceratobasidium sp. AG-Ba]QRW12020.1 hypothetical protein RhiLY_11019 [Ceratobasidium sp. AG-Ba]